jgi:hypothetical protein
MMKPFAAKLAGLLMAVAVCIAGCGTGSTTKGGSRTDSSADTSSTDLGSAPATEGSGPETPQQSVKGGPSISVASLPIGGAPAPGSDPSQQCASVNLLAPVPAGATVQLGDVSFDPDGVFQVGGGACPSDQTPCASLRWTQQSSPGCVVPVEQVTDSSATVTVIVSASVTCTSQSVCDDYKSQLDKAGGSEDQLTAVPLTSSGSSPGASATG